ncbi:hypothetical protein ACFQY5_38990 [Paeniroseomonas aquatica]
MSLPLPIVFTAGVVSTGAGASTEGGVGVPPVPVHWDMTTLSI